MKIVHLCLSCFYIDGYSYQENMLVQQHVKKGHDVTIIASTENYNDKGKITYNKPSEYMGQDGARVIRLPYRKLLPHKLMRKLRMHAGVLKLLKSINPDIVMFHGLCGWELVTVTAFCAQNPHIKYFVDSHEDYNNSARTFMSRYFLHKIYYRAIIRKCLRNIPRVLCVSLDTIEFVADIYGITRDKLEIFPLGGEVYDDKEYSLRRSRGRDDLSINENTILFMQTGKFDKRKKLIESLTAFSKSSKEDVVFVLAGVIQEEIAIEVLELIKSDNRIKFIGWKNGNEMQDLLCAADLYIQPGTQSATMQMSLCARCPIVLGDVLSHRLFYKNNGWLVNSQIELEGALESADSAKLACMSINSLKIAEELLNYEKLATRVLN